MTRRVVLAVNPTAGRGRGRRTGDAAEQQLRQAGLDVTRVQGRDAADASRRIRSALDLRVLVP